MARADYDLDSARDGQMVSSNGTEYTVNILWTAAENTTDMVFGSSGVQISYETSEDKTKNSYILSSKCTIPFLVQNATDKAFILSLATTYQERDIWITIREKFDPGATLFWCGYLLLDLKDEQDVDYPYEVTLTAVDGLAGLKETPFVRAENVDDASVPTFPYVVSDTYYSAGFCNIIGSATTINWLQELMEKTGMVLADDAVGGGGATYLTDYTFQTAVNVYNEGHPTPAADVDPLRLSQLNMQSLYSIDDNGFVTVPNCYQVLEYICKNFGMRCVYWKHTFHFIEIEQYNTDSAAASTASVPINIPSRHYYHTGLLYNNYNYIGSTNLTPYDLTLENVSSPGEGLQKLGGTIYSGLPAIKTTEAIYFGRPNANVYRGFPLLPYTWDTSGNPIDYTLFSGGSFTSPDPASGQVACGTIQDAADGDGIKFNTYLSFKNTTTTDLIMRVMFVLVAKPSSQTDIVGTDTHVLKRNAGQYAWAYWTSGSLPFTDSNAIDKYAASNVTFNPSPTIDQTVGVLAYDTATDPWCVPHNGLFPTHSHFTGSWDFTIFCWTQYDSNAVNKIAGVPAYGGIPTHGQINAFVNGYATNYAGAYLSAPHPLTSIGRYQDLDDYKYAYDNTLESGLSATAFKGTLESLGGPVVPEGNVHIDVDVDNKNSFIYDSGNYFWGDGSTMKVSEDATTYVAAGDGKWTKPTYAWNAGTSQFDYTVGSYNIKLVELNLKNILYNQSISLKQFNGTTALSETGKHYPGTTLMKYMNPIGKIIDLDSNQYQMMRGTFNLLLDEWNATMNQVFYEVPSETTRVGEQPIEGNLTIS